MIDEFLGVFCLILFKDFVIWGVGVFFVFFSFFVEIDCFFLEILDIGRIGVLKIGLSIFSDRFFFGFFVLMDLEIERFGVFFIFFLVGEFIFFVVDFIVFGWIDFRLVVVFLIDCVMEIFVVCDVFDEGLDGGDFGSIDLRFIVVFFGIVVFVLVVGLFLLVIVIFLVWE